MEKSCANHPESMALATCKACDKSVCLMCVVDEKEGTFCSADCHTAFANGQEVPKFVGAAAESGGSGGGVQKIDSIFDDDSAPAPSSGGLNVPPSDDRMPIVAEGTKWRPIGAQCENHADTPAVANCDRCGKPVCALCLLEAAQGTFCSSECMSGSGAPAAVEAPQQKNRPAPTYSAAAERAALQGKPVFKFKEPPRSNRTLITVAVVVLLVAGAAGAYYGWNAFTPDIPPGPRPPEYVTNTTDTTTKPEVTKPEVTKPEVTKPEVTKPEVTKPEVTKPEVTPPYVPPRPYVKPPPRPVAIPSRSLNPWGDTEPGTWYRLKTSRLGKDSYTDIGLKEKGKDFVVLVTQTCADGQASAVSEAKSSPSVVYLLGEQSFSFEGRSFLCEVQSPATDDASPKTWSLISGKNLGAVLKAISPEGTLTAKRVWDHAWRVKYTMLDCLVVEGQLESGGASRAVKSWYCSSVPLGLVRQEKPGESMTLVDLGGDWAKRPAFPK